MNGLLLSMVLAALPQREPVSLLLVTLDTFRGDFLGASGSDRAPRSATPNLDRLARRGALFTRARSPVPLTLPAHASLLTGLYPPEHGVRDNGRFRLEESHQTLAEALKDRGYETAAFVSSFVLDRRFGLSQGFEIYDDDLEAGTSRLESMEAERNGGEVRDSFDDWLRRRDGTRPFFAWVHLYDPHYPYEAPEPFRTRFASDPYAAEVAYTDAIVGEILERVPPTTLVAVVGDHGEGLGDHREKTHSLLIYNSTLHVPLILAGPDISSGRRIEKLARTIDLPATLLDYLGVPAAAGSGESLRPLLEGNDPEERTAYAESLYGFHHLGFSPLYSIESGDHRFIDAPRRELYDLTVDPCETKDLLEERRPVSRDLFGRLSELRASLGSASGARTEIDAETREKLQSLGYIPSSTASNPSGDLPDPKDEMETYHRIQEAFRLKDGGDCAGVIETLQTLDSRIPLRYELAASCHLELGQWDQASALARKALSLGFEAAVFHRDLGLAALRKGEAVEAERELEVAIALDESEVIARHHLGDALRAQKRDEAAARVYREALAINPRYVYSWNGLGMSLSRSGHNAEALEAFRKVVELDAEEPGGYFNLAVQLERMNSREEALSTFRHFLDISSEAKFARERARARQALGMPEN